MSELPKLLDRHREALEGGSGISSEVVSERGASSILSSDELKPLGFSDRQRRQVPGMLLPVHTADGANGLYVFRPDSPEIDPDGRPKKYLLPKNARPRLDVPPRCRPLLGDPTIDLWITEGQKKADALASRGLCAVALLGVWLFKGRNDAGGIVMLSDFDLIAWNGRQVRIVFDSDVMLKKAVQAALERVSELLRRRGAIITPIYLPDDGSGGKVGVDDFLLTHETEELIGLTGTSPQPPAPTVELLDAPPLMLDRPLRIVDGQAYAATWLHVRTTTRAGLGDDGKLIVFDPPRVQTERRLFVIREDGTVFGPGAERSLQSLRADDGVETKALETDFVRDDWCWRSLAVKAYRLGRRPSLVNVLERLVGLYDHFLDFKRSVADQSGMSELSAVLSLMTWLADAFDVMPYPWPNGGKGSGKTKWGLLWARTSYLGEVVSAASSFAALRDHAAFGGTLVVDDAEQLSDPKRCDPNVRNLLLAGNRRGTYVALKELVGKTWQTKYVESFAPRGFTAIRLPDDVLRSRSIVLPLVKSTDAERQRQDPVADDRWPCDRGELLDDLWATGLSLLTEARAIWFELEDDSSVVDGRLFDCWRGPLTVARLAERHGAEGLEARIRDVLTRYVGEQHEAQDDDRGAVLIQAVLRIASEGGEGDVRFKSSEAVETLKLVAADDVDTAWATSSRVGRALKTLRIRQAARSGRERGWLVTLDEAKDLALSYGVRLDEFGTSTARMTLHDQPAQPSLLDTPAVPALPAPSDGSLSNLASQASEASLVSPPADGGELCLFTACPEPRGPGDRQFCVGHRAEAGGPA